MTSVAVQDCVADDLVAVQDCVADDLVAVQMT